MHYLDDHFGGAPDFSIAKKQFDLFNATCAELGVDTNVKKSFAPAKVQEILGFTYDTEKGIVYISNAKRKGYIDHIDTLIKEKCATIDSLQSIVGKFRFASTAIFGGNALLRRIESFIHKNMRRLNIKYSTRYAKNPLKIRLEKVVIKDLRWLREAILTINRMPFGYILKDTSVYDIELFTDAAYAYGYGVFIPKFNEYAYEKIHEFPKWAVGKDSTILELIAVAIALHSFGERFTGKMIRIRCDNQAVCDMLNKHRCKLDRNIDLLRLLRFTSLRANKCQFKYFAKHIDGDINVTADRLSRNRLSEAKIPPKASKIDIKKSVEIVEKLDFPI